MWPQGDMDFSDMHNPRDTEDLDNDIEGIGTIKKVCTVGYCTLFMVSFLDIFVYDKCIYVHIFYNFYLGKVVANESLHLYLLYDFV